MTHDVIQLVCKYGIENPLEKTMVIDTPEGIEMFRLLSMKGRLQLELKGLRFRTSTLKAVNRTLGTNYRRKQQALDALIQHIEEVTR